MRGGIELSTQKNVSEQQLQTQFTYIDAVARLNGGKCPKAYTHTFGCQQNEADTERIRGMLHEMGYEMTDSTEEADFILFNTCAVRACGGSCLRQHRRAEPSQKKRPDVVIALCGCMAQQEKNVLKRSKKLSAGQSAVRYACAVALSVAAFYRVLTDRKRVFDIGGEDDDIAGGAGACTSREGCKGLALYHVWLQQFLYLLYRALCPRQRARSPTGRD